MILDQAKRLKIAGFEQYSSEYVIYVNYLDKPYPIMRNIYAFPREQEWFACPTEKEMMEWLKNKNNILAPISYWICHDVDLTEELVQAIELSLKNINL